MRKFFIVYISLFFCVQVAAQNGRPIVINYSPRDYSGEDQIWTLVQDHSGLLYFGGYNGVYVYDGEKWEFVGESNRFSTVLSLNIDEHGTVFVGYVDGFGYLKPNEHGKPEIISLSEELDSSQTVTDVWTMACVGETAYFCSDEAVFRYHPDSMPAVKNIFSTFNPYLLYKVENNVFVSDENGNFNRIMGDSVGKIDGMYGFSPWFMLPFAKGIYLTGSYPKGLQIYDSNETDTAQCIKTYEYFDREIIDQTNKILLEHQLYTGAVQINDTQYAIGTISNGIYIINKKGKIIEHINKPLGLQSQTVHTLYKDRQNILWAALSYGISKIEVNSPYRIFDQRDNLEGIFYNIIRSKSGLYITSNLGMYFFNGYTFNSIAALSDENSVQVFMPFLKTFSDSSEYLFVNTVNGIYFVKDHIARKINNHSPSSIFESKIDKDDVFFSENSSLYKFKKTQFGFTKPELIKNFKGITVGGFQKDNGEIWLLEDYKPVLLDTKSKKVKRFLKNSEIEGVHFYYPVEINNNDCFVTDNGLYMYDYIENIFRIPDDYKKISHSKLQLSQIEIEDKNSIWVLFSKSKNSLIAHFDYSGDNLVIDTVSFKQTDGVHTIYLDGDSLIWALSSDKIYKFKRDLDIDISEKSKVIIRKIILNNDSLIRLSYSSQINFGRAIPEFSYSDNDILFEFSLPSYLNEEANKYSWKLEGRKRSNWSTWSKESFKEYTNLHEGLYTFKVKARNVYLQETDLTEFKFVILAPWYRSVLAYIIYFLLLFILIYILVKLNARRLEKENTKLESLVRQRTAEILTQKEEIQTQADHLEEANAELSLKNEEINAIAESLIEANQKIKDKNEYIVDSINYAKKIQTAVLPFQETLDKVLKDYFVIYKPKDIVSGDFYYVRKISEYLIIAVADCTGHGVPGGFLSMMGYSLLNDIIRNKHIQKPSDALELMRTRIKSALKQKEYFSGRTDGIDMALCAINLKLNKLQFAGANISAYIVRKSKPDILQELKADPQPVGIHYNETEFGNHFTDLNAGDIIYMFTDGIYDQLGGDANKKYLLSNFKKTILKNAQESMKVQRRNIMSDHVKWKANNKQLDDILVFAYRFD